MSLSLPSAALTQCGGDFASFLDGIRAEALARGHAPAEIERFLKGARQDQKVLASDRRQGVFQLDFTRFARRLISNDRLARGRQNAQRWQAVFDTVRSEYGVSQGVLLAFWAFETDYGAYQGDFNTRNALLTLAHDCRRPELFRPQALAAIALQEAGGFDPATTTGAWAGEVGMVQMLPADILAHGTDGDGDGRVDLKRSVPDAILSGARMLAHLGWRRGEPWLQEVDVPAELDWSQSGIDKTRPAGEWARLGVRARTGELAASLPASLVLPQGRNGPAFLAYPNFEVFLKWNQSLTYVLTAAYFANRLEGAPVFDAGRPEPGLDEAGMKRLQRLLQARGYDVGKIDGILGAGTRAAVQREQQRLGLPADAWPDRRLLSVLE